jgi:hypothetical protein
MVVASTRPKPNGQKIAGNCNGIELGKRKSSVCGQRDRSLAVVLAQESLTWLVYTWLPVIEFMEYLVSGQEGRG